jgi:hypothetical protein
MDTITNKLHTFQTVVAAYKKYMKFILIINLAIIVSAINVMHYPVAANGSEYEQNMINDIQIKIQEYKSSNMSVGNRAKFVSELEIEKSTIIAGSDSQQAIQNLESTEYYIKSLNISPGNERKLLDFVRKAKIVLLRRGVPNSTFPGFNY